MALLYESAIVETLSGLCVVLLFFRVLPVCISSAISLRFRVFFLVPPRKGFVML